MPVWIISALQDWGWIAPLARYGWYLALLEGKATSGRLNLMVHGCNAFLFPSFSLGTPFLEAPAFYPSPSPII